MPYLHFDYSPRLGGMLWTEFALIVFRFEDDFYRRTGVANLDLCVDLFLDATLLGQIGVEERLFLSYSLAF